MALTRSTRSAIGVGALLTLGLGLATVLGALAGAGPARGQLREDPPLEPSTRVGEGRSVIVYPPQALRLRMSHAHPAHAALACTECHARAASSERSEESLLPSEQACVRCHAETDRDTPSVEDCGTCHVGVTLPPGEEGAPDLVGRLVIPASRMPAPRLRFSHAAHADAEGGCERCHAGVRRATLATRAHLPTMQQCLECHAVAGLASVGLTETTRAVDAAPLACVGCHEALPDGRVRAHTSEGWMNPPRWMAGMRHDHEWLVRHRWIAADAGPLCAECHVERECADCHDGRIRPRRTHPGDYLSTHATMARRDEGRCTSCHSVGTFCSECHARLGLATFSAPTTRGSARHHPPQAVWIRGPNLHGIEAQRSLQSCISCHAEDDCVACHGAGAVGGGGISPHPPGFANGCAVALATTPAACIRCHGDAEALRARCR